MSASRTPTSVISRLATRLSFRSVSRVEAAGVTSLKPPLPEGFGKMLPSMSQNLLRAPYSVSSVMDVSTGRRGCMSSSKNLHIASGSAICVSASMTPAMIASLERTAPRSGRAEARTVRLPVFTASGDGLSNAAERAENPNTSFPQQRESRAAGEGGRPRPNPSWIPAFAEWRVEQRE